MSLFDYFPSQEQERQLTAWVIPGSIVYLNCGWIEKSCRDKYLVVGATQPECLLLMVNTEERYSAPVATQVHLLVINYSGVLTGNCYVNCDTVVTQLTYNGISQQLRGDGSRYRGRLTADDQREVVSAIKYARDISPIHQDMLIGALEAA